MIMKMKMMILQTENCQKIVREKIVMISWTELNNVFTKNKTTEADKNTKICTH